MSKHGFIFIALFLLAALPSATPAQCTDCDGDGQAWPMDCNDADPDVYLGAPEPCDGIDSDCNGTVDDDPGCDGVCDDRGLSAAGSRLTDGTVDSDVPTLVSNGSGFAVSWSRLASGGLRVHLMLLDDQGRLITIERAVSATTSLAFEPSLAWTGSEYGIAWHDERDGNAEIYFLRADATGLAAGGDVRVTSAASPSRFASLVWTGNEYGIAWQDRRDGNWEIYFTRLDASGAQIGGDVRVTDQAGLSRRPSLVWNGSGYAVAWEDARDGNDEIYLALLVTRPQLSYHSLC